MKLQSTVSPRSFPLTPQVVWTPSPFTEKVSFVPCPVALVVELFEFPDEHSVLVRSLFSCRLFVGASPSRVRPIPFSSVHASFQSLGKGAVVTEGSAAFNTTDGSSLVALF